MYYDIMSIETIRKNIEKSLKMHKIKCEVTIENNGRAIGIDNEFGDDYANALYIWIRILPTQRGTYYVDISNIVLPMNKRRQGVFNTLFTRLNNCKYVEKTRIISVCTPEMLNWCKKNNLNEFQSCCYC